MSSLSMTGKDTMSKRCLSVWHFSYPPNHQEVVTLWNQMCRFYETYFVHSLLLVHLIMYQFYISTAAVLLKDVTVQVNEWAQFNCTVHCGYHVSWYMAGHSSAIKRNNAVPGLLIKRRCAFMCTDSGERIYFFEVPATKAFHFTVLQMRDIDIKKAAVVEQMGGVTAGLPSSWVSLFAIGSCIVSYPYTFKLVSCWQAKEKALKYLLEYIVFIQWEKQSLLLKHQKYTLLLVFHHTPYKV